MRTTVIRIILALFMLSLVLPAKGLSVSASVDRNRINLDEVITFKVTIEGTRDFPDVPVPQSDGFVIISGPSQSSSIQIVNGAMSASKIIQWRLAPTQTGEQTINPIVIKYRRKNYSTKPIKIQVNERGAPAAVSRQPSPARPPSPQQSRPVSSNQGEVFLKTEVARTIVYKGTELLVFFNLYFKNVRNYAPQKLPDAKGFWTEQFPEKRNPTVTTEIINGKAYKKATLRRLALFPTTTGELTIDPMQITCEVPAPSQRRRSVFDDFFDDSFMNDPFFSRTKTVQIQSEPLKIQVKELPAEGRPANFGGAVGNYVIESSIDTLQIRQNQALTLRYSISGSGNINAVKLPDLELSSNVEIFEPTVERQVNNKGKSIRGRVSYEYVLIPRSSGRLRIPAMTFVYFNSQNGRYQTTTAQGYTVSVKAVDQSDIASGAGFRKEEVSLLGSDIRFIMRDMPRWRPIGSSIFKRFWFWLFNLISIGLVAGSMTFRRWMEKMAGNSLFARRRRAFTRAQQLLKEVQTALGQEHTDTVCGKLDRSLSGFISDRMGLAQSGFGPREIQAALQKQAVDHNLLEAVISILNELEQLRFLPGSLNHEDYIRLHERVNELLLKLVKVI